MIVAGRTLAPGASAGVETTRYPWNYLYEWSLLVSIRSSLPLGTTQPAEDLWI